MGRCIHEISAHKACSKCLKTFPTAQFGEKPDYSGFDRQGWTARSNETHRHHDAFQHKICQTRSNQVDIERQHGCRYSDPILMCVIDPMHNLLLGNTRHMMTIWKEFNIVNQAIMNQIQERVDSYVSRIPSKISSGFSGFTAEQWRNWTIHCFASRMFFPFNITRAGVYLSRLVLFCADALFH